MGLMGLPGLLVAGCGNPGTARFAPPVAAARPASPGVTAAALNSYVSAVEAIRLPVNRLLGQADPIIEAYHDHRISPSAAAQQMGTLEQQFAMYLLQIQAISPPDPTLARINGPYAHTYLLEDSYLATLASDLADGDFGNLPDTQGQQRLAIIQWRTQLQLAAARVGVLLPADMEQAGRGEIAPALTGS